MVRILLLVLLLKPPNHVTSLLYLNLCTGSKLMNKLITSYSLLHIRFSLPRSPLTCITLSLSNLLAVLVLPLLWLLLALHPAPRWKSQTFLSDMHHLISGTNFLFRYVSFVLINLLHLHPLHYLHCHHPSHLHFFILSYKDMSFPKIFSSIDTHTHQPDWLHGFLAVSVFLLLNGFLFSSHFIYFLVHSAVR